MISITTSYETLAYITPVPVRGMILKENRFLKIKLLERYYFISVLPGFHQSTLEELAKKIQSFFLNFSPDYSNIDFKKKYFNLTNSTDISGSNNNEALFYIETLLLGMLQTTHPGLFKNQILLVNELYRPESGTARYVNSKCLKIKISPGTSRETIQVINELHLKNIDLIIRLDGNRLFELNELIELVADLEKGITPESFLKIDYLEEPLKNFYDTFLFQKRSRLKIAMDESFSSYLGSKSFPENTRDTPIVIKPSLFGISSIYNWMHLHPKNRTIISSSFEHPSVRIGLDFLAAERPLEFHGLENFLN